MKFRNKLYNIIEALEYGEKVKTEPDEFEDGDKKPLEDKDKDEDGSFNACDVEQVKPKPEEFKL